MRRLYVVVEGPTEEAFVKKVLGPHLDSVDVWTTPFKVNPSRDPRTGQRRGTGGGQWRIWHRDITRFTKQERSDDVRFTTLFDLYGLPNDFPGLGEHGTVRDTSKRAALLEQRMAEIVADHRFVPYLQRHEMEALVLAGLGELDALLDAERDKSGLAVLREEIGATNPEDVDDGPETAPSKRLMSAIPSYQKSLHGPLVAEQVGLPTLRARCPRFDAWVGRLESL